MCKALEPSKWELFVEFLFPPAQLKRVGRKADHEARRLRVKREAKKQLESTPDAKRETASTE